MLKKIIYWILMFILIVFILYYICVTVFFNINKSQICVLINPTEQISKSEINALQQIAPYHNETWFDKNILQRGIKLEIMRHNLNINWFFWLHC